MARFFFPDGYGRTFAEGSPYRRVERAPNDSLTLGQVEQLAALGMQGLDLATVGGFKLYNAFDDRRSPTDPAQRAVEAQANAGKPLVAGPPTGAPGGPPSLMAQAARAAAQAGVDSPMAPGNRFTPERQSLDQGMATLAGAERDQRFVDQHSGSALPPALQGGLDRAFAGVGRAAPALGPVVPPGPSAMAQTPPPAPRELTATQARQIAQMGPESNARLRGLVEAGRVVIVPDGVPANAGVPGPTTDYLPDIQQPVAAAPPAPAAPSGANVEMVDAPSVMMNPAAAEAEPRQMGSGDYSLRSMREEGTRVIPAQGPQGVIPDDLDGFTVQELAELAQRDISDTDRIRLVEAAADAYGITPRGFMDWLSGGYTDRAQETVRNAKPRPPREDKTYKYRMQQAQADKYAAQADAARQKAARDAGGDPLGDELKRARTRAANALAALRDRTRRGGSGRGGIGGGRQDLRWRKQKRIDVLREEAKTYKDVVGKAGEAIRKARATQTAAERSLVALEARLNGLPDINALRSEAWVDPEKKLEYEEAVRQKAVLDRQIADQREKVERAKSLIASSDAAAREAEAQRKLVERAMVSIAEAKTEDELFLADEVRLRDDVGIENPSDIYNRGGKRPDADGSRGERSAPAPDAEPGWGDVVKAAWSGLFGGEQQPVEPPTAQTQAAPARGGTIKYERGPDGKLRRVQ